MTLKKVLVTEVIAEEGLDVLRKKGYEVDVNLGLSQDELIEVIPSYDALIVRSATKVNAEVLASAQNLKIVGRAGVTYDNIDIEAAAERGVIVCNAPTSNVVSAAEHTIALMMAAARRIPQANASMHAHEWTRYDFTGVELYNKTLAIFGLGRIGGLVAERAAGFGMRILGFDPYCSEERAAELGVKLVASVDDILEQADFITIHLPKTAETYHMFGPEQFAKMKDGVILVNAARGCIVDADSLADFVAAGKIGAAAIDVYEVEPCTESPLHEFGNVILTPHIAAVTREAQIRAGREIAEYVWAGLEGSIVPTAINSSSLPPEVIDEVGPYVPACQMMGRVLAQIIGATPKDLSVEAAGALSDANSKILLAGVLDGLLSYRRIGTVNIANVDAVASRHGVTVDSTTVADAQEYASLVSASADGVEVAATVFGQNQAPRIVSLMGYKIDVAPARQSLVFEYVDQPGRVGVIGTVLGSNGVNISTMQIGTKPENQTALVYMNVEGDISEDVIEQLHEALELKNLWYISL